MESHEFRVYAMIPGIGFVGLLFSAYVTAFSVGLTDIILFTKVHSFREAFPTSLPFVGLMFVGGMLLCAQLLVRVVLSPSSISYIGVFRRKTIPWADVASVEFLPHFGHITIRSASTVIVIDWRFVRRALLVEQIRGFCAHRQSRIEPRQRAST